MEITPGSIGVEFSSTTWCGHTLVFGNRAVIHRGRYSTGVFRVGRKASANYDAGLHSKRPKREIRMKGFLRSAFLGFLFFSVCATTIAQYRSATIAGTVHTSDGEPLPGTRIQCVLNGQTLSLITNAHGIFQFYFAAPGIYSCRFEHVSVSEAGAHEATLRPGSSLNLTAVVYRNSGSGASDIWSIEERAASIPDVWRAERLLTESYIQSLPSTEHLWALLNQTEPSVVTDHYDPSGFYSTHPFLAGVRGSSWSQNQGLLNGQTITDPSGAGMLMFPDMTTMEAIVYTVGGSPTRHTGPGAHLELIPKSGRQEQHGQAQLFFQSGALQNENVSARNRAYLIAQSDERWKYYLTGGLQSGGPLGPRWTYFGALSARDLKKWIRNRTLPISGAVGQETLNLSGELSATDRLSFFASWQQRYEPQSDASPQITSESSVNQHQSYNVAQASWSRSISSRTLLELKLLYAQSNLKSRFQPGVRGQSTEDLFPGFVVDGLSPRLPPPGALFTWLNDTTRGPAPLVTSYDAASLEGSVLYSTVRDGFGRSNHRITIGGSTRRSAFGETNESIEGVNLLIFQQRPNSVRVLNTPAQTRVRSRQFQWYASDTLSFSRWSFMAALSADSNSGASVLRSGRATDRLHWTNIGGRVGTAFQITSRRPFVVRAGLAKIYDQPTVRPWTATNPEGLAVRLYSWNDVNGDLQFQRGENAQLLKVYGGPYSRIDPKLENPRTSEVTVGFSQSGIGKFGFEMFGFRRSVQRLMSLVNEGVPFSSYTPVHAVDPGPDAVLHTSDDRPITVYNQNADTLGQDRYVLTSPKGFSSHSEGMELKLRFSARKTRIEAAVTRYRAVAATAPGIGPLENDTSALRGVFDDPNNSILARGSTYFDRGTLGRLLATTELGWKTDLSMIASYQDGLPYARILPIQGLNQGVIGVLTTQRGSGEAGSKIGLMTAHYETLNARLSKKWRLGNKTLVGTLDVFNLLNLSQPLLMSYVTAKSEHWRVPLRFETPRSLQMGIRLTW
jgi:hypothetical protein